MRPMWFKPSDTETTVDYRYTYDGQKPHTVSSIVDNNTETLFTYTYDASGNNLLETNSKASSDREIVWTEDNRLAAIKAKGNVSHYVYDANGIRTLKMSSSGFNISINGVAAGTNGIDGNFTIYANPYTVVRENQCTKHFFLGSQRILTKISSSDVSQTFYEGHAQGQVGGVDYESKQTALESNITINNKQLNIGWYRETRGRVPSPYIKHYLRAKEHGGLSGNNPWGEDNTTSDNDNSTSYEEKQYYFHPDHLGSTNYLTDVTGESYQHVAYLPWGEVFVEQRNTQTSRNVFLYTGKELDEATGLYYYEQRYYDALKSTFLGVDRLAEKYAGLTPYHYGANNPIRYIDVNGDSLWINHRNEQILYENGKLYNKDGTDYSGKALKVNKDGSTKLKGFVSKTVNALNNIDAGKEGAGMLREIEGSTDNVTIVKNTGNGNSYQPGINTVKFDPSSKNGGLNTRGSTDRPTFIGLGHELAHSLDDIRGTLNSSRITGQTFTYAEHFATDMENKMRAEHFLPLRTHYGITGGVGIYPLIDASGNSLHSGGHNYYGALKLTPIRAIMQVTTVLPTLKLR